MPDDWKRGVGPVDLYDVIGAHVFSTLVSFGLRSHHSVLDVGAGNLRVGRLLLPWLDKGNYYAVEPNEELFIRGANLLGGDFFLNEMEAWFSSTAKFHFSVWGEPFDFILIHSVFTHAPLSAVKLCLSNAAAVLADGGKIVGTFNNGYEDYSGDDWEWGKGIFYKSETICEVVKSAGLKVEFRKSHSQRHPTKQHWFTAKNGIAT